MSILIIKGRDIFPGRPYLPTPQDTYPKRDSEEARKNLGTTHHDRVKIINKKLR
jgi:hypothetical protein